VARFRLTRPAEAKIEEALAYSLSHYGSDAARRYRALIFQAMRDLATQWQILLRRGQARRRDGLLIYPLRASRRNVPRAIGQVANPRGFIVGRIDHDGALVVLTLVGEGMLDANIAREARASGDDDKRRD
jgi:toxin ParE1/3/4